MAREFELSFKEALKARRRAMTQKTREKTRNNPKKIVWVYPLSAEIKYRKQIRDILGLPLKKRVNQTIQADLQRWIEEKKRTDIRKDTWIDEIRQFIRSLGIQITDIFGAPEDLPENTDLWPVLIILALGIFDFNEKQFKKATKSQLGFEFVTDTAWWDNVRDAWASENYALIKSLSEDYIGKVNEIVFQGVRQGLSYREIIKELRESYEKTYGPREDGKASRLELLVRDQVGKLNGEITKQRMREVGGDYYIWNTAFDERVRGRPGGKYPKALPSHWAMEGKICRWDDNSLYADEGDVNEKGELNWKMREGNMPIAIPGDEILCRCTAIIYWNQILSEIDREIEE